MRLKKLVVGLDGTVCGGTVFLFVGVRRAPIRRFVRTSYVLISVSPYVGISYGDR